MLPETIPSNRMNIRPPAAVYGSIASRTETSVRTSQPKAFSAATENSKASTNENRHSRIDSATMLEYSCRRVPPSMRRMAISRALKPVWATDRLI